jgi:ribosome-binding protein aMBF1 (putative translation factor)
MEYQTIKENGIIKFVVLPVDEFNRLLANISSDMDIEAIRSATEEPLYDQKEAEDYIFMNPVKRERLEKGWTQEELASKMKVRQSTIAKWERQGAVFRKATRKKFADLFGIDESAFM